MDFGLTEWISDVSGSVAHHFNFSCCAQRSFSNFLLCRPWCMCKLVDSFMLRLRRERLPQQVDRAESIERVPVARKCSRCRVFQSCTLITQSRENRDTPIVFSAPENHESDLFSEL